MNINKYKYTVLHVRNPLIFFSLALLIIEGIIGIVALKSKINADQQFYVLCIMAFLFFTVVVIVALITIKWPSHLYEDVRTFIKR